MKTQKIGSSTLHSSRIVMGCMRIGGTWDEAALDDSIRNATINLIDTALKAGITIFDHADIYCRGKSEKAFASVWEKHTSLRDKIILQTKCGIRFAGDVSPTAPQRYDFSYEHITTSVEGSLKRLKTDWIDTLLLHRPDPLMEPEEVAQAFNDLHASGKVRWFGVSNHSGQQIALLRKYVSQPIIVNQLQFNALQCQLVEDGMSVNQTALDRPRSADGTLEYCRLHDITIQAYSPIANGLLTGGRPSEEERVTACADLIQTLAKEKNTSPDAIAIAWILRHPARIQPVMGTTKPERLLAACEAESIELSREEWYRILAAGRGKPVA